MSESYKRLGADIPASTSGAGVFVADARKVKAWVAALPRANAQATEQELTRALDSLVAQRLSGTQRLGALEEMRAAVIESVNLLERQFSGNPLPLPPELARAASSAESFHLMLAHGYRRAAHDICAPAGAVPFLKGGAVLQSLERAAWHYARALALAWRIYRPPGAGAWQGLHRVHRFAAQIKLDHKRVDDAVAGSSQDVNALYVQALLLAVVNPYAFAQAEQDALWPITRGYAERCALSEQPPDGLSPVVPEDADRGPGPGAGEESHSLWLDLGAFAQDVERALSRVRDGQSELSPSPGVIARVGNDLLIRLQRAFGQIAARSQTRLPAVHRLDTVLGLSGLHYFLSGQRDFETFMRQSAQGTVHVIAGAAWTQAAAGMTKVARFPGKVMDQSLGGYRMVWASAEQARARVGELVGLNFGDEGEEHEWMVGVMRWLRYENDGSLSAGVELLSRRGSAVALRVAGGGPGSAVPSRALEIMPMDDRHGRCFIANAAIEAGSPIEVIHDVSSHFPEIASTGPDVLANLEVLLNAGDYVLLGEREPAAQGEPA